MSFLARVSHRLASDEWRLKGDGWRVKGDGWRAMGVFVSKAPVGFQSLGRFCYAKFLLLLIGINRFVGGIFGRALTCASAVFCSSDG